MKPDSLRDNFPLDGQGETGHPEGPRRVFDRTESVQVDRPTGDKLAEVINGIFVRRNQEAPVITNRQPQIFESTFCSETLKCRFYDGTTTQLLCKYGLAVAGHAHSSYGHRGGLAHEAAVYSQVLANVENTVATYYGFHADPDGTEWLLLEFLENVWRANKSPDLLAMGAAASWAGAFHARAPVKLGAIAGLMAYDRTFYNGWLERSLDILDNPMPKWLELLYQRREEVFTCLLRAPQSLFHGEFYPHNILYREGTIYPVDWESAAVAPGEIDLAALMFEWPAPEANNMEWRYCATRWPGGTPRSFESTIAAAEVYVAFRNIADGPEDPTYMLHSLRIAGMRGGWIE